MWTYHPELLETPVPRYTSYPTAAEFHDGIGAVAQRKGLERVGASEEISLYVHIPYCRKICWYCGCNTGAANRTSRMANYLRSLEREIELIAGHLDGRGRITRVAFGGGSPNAISAIQFSDLVARLRGAFAIDPDAVWSVEIDPRGFTGEFADALAAAGFQRASLGVQSFDAAIQQRIGRVQPFETIADATLLLRGAGVTSINFDLMYGLPGQTQENLLDSVRHSLSLGSDRLAVFGYAHVPHLIPRQRRIEAHRLPNAEQRFVMAATVDELLLRENWLGVGFDHYARPGDPLAVAASKGAVRRNFQGFTDDPCDTLIGLGASSISRFAGSLVQNEKNSGRYGLRVENGVLPATRGVAVDAMERGRARSIEAILCSGRADLSGMPSLHSVRSRLEPFEERGLIDWSGCILRLSPDAKPYARTIAAALDPWRALSGTRFSSAV